MTEEGVIRKSFLRVLREKDGKLAVYKLWTANDVIYSCWEYDFDNLEESDIPLLANAFSCGRILDAEVIKKQCKEIMARYLKRMEESL
jgi:hypothetical protein